MFTQLKTFKRNKTLNYQKEQYRGTIKQIMKVRGLRTISLSNYNNWKGTTADTSNGVHSLKIDVQDGYVNIYGYGTACNHNGSYRCGNVISDASAETYKSAYEQVMDILSNEDKIPYKVRKNILVKMAR